MAMLGVPYGDAVNRAPQMAREQATEIAAEIERQGGPSDLADKQIVAMVAYMQRLGMDIKAIPTTVGVRQ
jgi:cytochrome c oxidase cbb3-type subunit I/II